MGKIRTWANMLPKVRPFLQLLCHLISNYTPLLHDSDVGRRYNQWLNKTIHHGHRGTIVATTGGPASAGAIAAARGTAEIGGTVDARASSGTEVTGSTATAAGTESTVTAARDGGSAPAAAAATEGTPSAADTGGTLHHRLMMPKNGQNAPPVRT
ncbi:unnamed protein product [Gadus morhua 'NCC']